MVIEKYINHDSIQSTSLWNLFLTLKDTKIHSKLEAATTNLLLPRQQ